MHFTQESKLDDSLPQSQFEVPGYKVYHQDQRTNTGNTMHVMAIITSDIVHRWAEKLKNIHLVNVNRIEVLVLELILKGETGYLAACINNQR